MRTLSADIDIVPLALWQEDPLQAAKTYETVSAISNGQIAHLPNNGSYTACITAAVPQQAFDQMKYASLLFVQVTARELT